MKLYDYELSGNCYKVRYLLHALGLACERVAIDFHPGREHKSDWFLAQVNPLGQLPVLEVDGAMLRDAQAILVYLASRHDAGGTWYPEAPRARAEIQVWLGVAEELTRTASAARLHDTFGYALDVERCRAGAHAVLRVLDDHLAERHATGERWLACGHVTIADLACFPYAALAIEGGVSLDEAPAVRRWIRDFRHQDAFIPMAGIIAPRRPTQDASDAPEAEP